MYSVFMKTFILVLLLLNISAPHNKAEDVSVASTVRSEQLSFERASQDTSEQEDGSVASTTDSEKPSSEKDTSKQNLAGRNLIRELLSL